MAILQIIFFRCAQLCGDSQAAKDLLLSWSQATENWSPTWRLPSLKWREPWPHDLRSIRLHRRAEELKPEIITIDWLFDIFLISVFIQSLSVIRERKVKIVISEKLTRTASGLETRMRPCYPRELSWVVDASNILFPIQYSQLIFVTYNYFQILY